MDPLSITVACVSLTTSIAKTSTSVTLFVRAVRAARSDLDGVSRELASLTTLLGILAEDAKDIDNFPDTLRKHITGILANCELVLVEVQRLVAKYDKPGVVAGSKWALAGHEDVARLQLSLEAHKSALEIALEMVTLSISKEIKKDTTELLDDTAAIKNDTSQILQEIARLRAQLPDDGATLLPSKKDSGSTLATYLDDLTSYAETVCWSGEDSDTDGENEDAKPPPKLKSAKPIRVGPLTSSIPLRPAQYTPRPESPPGFTVPPLIRPPDETDVYRSTSYPTPDDPYPTYATADGERATIDHYSRPATIPAEFSNTTRDQPEVAPLRTSVPGPHFNAPRPPDYPYFVPDVDREVVNYHTTTLDKPSSCYPLEYTPTWKPTETPGVDMDELGTLRMPSKLVESQGWPTEQHMTAQDWADLPPVPISNASPIPVMNVEPPRWPTEQRMTAQDWADLPPVQISNTSPDPVVSDYPYTLFTVRAFCDYSYSYGGGPGFSKGQIIHVTDDTDKNWYVGHIEGESASAPGYFPKVYFELCESVRTTSLAAPFNAQSRQTVTSDGNWVAGRIERPPALTYEQGLAADSTAPVAESSTPSWPDPFARVMEGTVINSYAFRNTGATFAEAWRLHGDLPHTSKRRLTLQRHERTGEIAVVKSYPRTHKHGPRYNVRIMREAQILGLFDHPHIVKIRYFVRTLDNWLLYFEDTGSITLSQYIHRYGSTSPQAQYHERMDPIKWDRLVHRFAQQIGSALRYCHLNCVHHSSLRSDKIVVSRAGDVKITGFGSYRLVEEHWGQCFDTFCYGTILWHMMCGSVLWPMTDSWDRYSCVVQFELVKPEHIPPQTFNLLSRLLYYDDAVPISSELMRTHGLYPRMSLKRALEHPWFQDGGPPVPDFMPQRKPLTTPLDINVINKLEFFDFGTPAQIESDLFKIIKSTPFKDSVNVCTNNALEAGSIPRGGTFNAMKVGWKMGTARRRAEKTELQGAALDLALKEFWELLRSRVASPVLAMYYLAMEKMEREKVVR